MSVNITEKKILWAVAGIVIVTMFFAAGFFSENAYGFTKTTAKATVSSSDGAVVRAKKSVSSLTKNTLGHGTRVSVSSVWFTSKSSEKAKYKWYYLPKYKGYVRGDLVSVSYGTSSGKVKTALNLRNGAGKGFKNIALLSPGEKVDIKLRAYARDGSKWYYVKVGSRSGFVAEEYITVPSSSMKKKAGKRSTVKRKTETDTYSGFPASYRTRLAALKKAHPNWKFVPVNTGLNWSQAVHAQTCSDALNLTHTVYPYCYRSVNEGSYNYLTHTYVGRDGKYFVAASKKAVKYYMDPRNWLTAQCIFMFEDHRYHAEYQSQSAVKTVLKNNPKLKKKSATYVAAGKKYNISPIYLAVKSMNELGPYTYMLDGHSFKYGSRTYSKCYNVFNIGASDSASGGAVNGLLYANGGRYGIAKTYGRKWDKIEKAITGGTSYISRNFLGNNQNSYYLEHFNVLNGLSNVGTHEYMTAVYAPNTLSRTTYTDYKDYKIINKKITFYIPVYRNMPSKVSAKPSLSWDKDNNYYLKTLKAGNKTLISSKKLNYNKVFSVRVPRDTGSIKISAAKASVTNAKIYGTGTKNLHIGKNTFKVVCKASSGEKRTYTVVINRQ